MQEGIMSAQTLADLLQTQLEDLKKQGLYKRERQIQGPQGSAIKVGGREVINFCANNYLGLANHPAIVEAAFDGIRLCKAQRYRYKNCDMGDLEKGLKEAQGSRLRLIATDGVFSMDGLLAPLPDICALADRHDAIVMVDDSHATGILGAGGRGTPEHHGVLERIDIITSTLGKTLGGAAGGFTCARQEVVDYLRQRSRPYLFSNAVPPPIIQATLRALDLVAGSSELRDRLHANARWLRQALEGAGFTLKP